MHRWLLGAILLAGALASMGANGLVTWTSDSTLATNVVDPPIQFVKGDNADNQRYFRSFELSANATSFTATAKPRGGADVHVSDVVRIDNSAGSQSYQIQLTASEVSNIFVEKFDWKIRNGSTPVATLDYLEANPQVSFTLPAGQVFTQDLEIDLGDGAGRLNAGIDFDLQLEVTS